MMKTRLGISVGMFGALTYFFAMFGSNVGIACLITMILAGYALLFEENPWLKRSCVRGVILMVAFMVIRAIVGLIPDIASLVYDFTVVLEDPVSLVMPNAWSGILGEVITLLEKVLFFLLGFLALNMRTIRLPLIDNFVSKHMN